MSIITVSQLRDYFKNVSDWVTGSSSSRPKMVITGQNEADGTNGEAASFVLDSNNRPVTRYIDAAPFAYDGTADAKKVKNVSADGSEIFTQTNPGSIQLSGSNLPLVAGTAEIGSILRAQKKVTIASAVNIVDADYHTYNLITHGGMTEAEVRKYTEWQISILSTHTNAGLNATADIDIFKGFVAYAPGLTSPTTQAKIYTEAGVIPNGNTSLLYGARAGGTGVNAGYKVIPTLEGIFSNILVRVKFANAPTSGALTIVLEGRS